MKTPYYKIEERVVLALIITAFVGLMGAYGWHCLVYELTLKR